MSESNKNSTPDTSSLYPIRTVCSITGINPVTLRAWERRYGLIKPHRTEKGHRLYTQADIDRINETVRLLDQGIPVSQVRQVLDSRNSERATTVSVSDHWSRYINDMLNALSKYDENRLDAIYNEALSLYPVDTVMRQMIIPLLHELGRRWVTKEGSIAEEHFFGVFIRNKLGARFHHLRSSEHGPKLLAACLPNEFHEIGLLIFSLVAKSLGYEIVLLGANMPLEELPFTVRQAQIDAIILSGSQAYSNKAISTQLNELVEKTDIPIFVGGYYSIIARDTITEAGAIPIGEDVTQAFKLVNRTLSES